MFSFLSDILTGINTDNNIDGNYWIESETLLCVTGRLRFLTDLRSAKHQQQDSAGEQSQSNPADPEVTGSAGQPLWALRSLLFFFTPEMKKPPKNVKEKKKCSCFNGMTFSL